MTDGPGQNPDPQDEPGQPVPSDDVPVEDTDAPETPRRAASAQFVVDAAVGSEAALREAMDPANQSLTEALRLSYRVLQVVILVLIILFVFSGWKSVQDGQTGVLSVWGRIAEVDGSRALTPGLKFSKWPYPAGEFVLFTEENRPVDVGNAFWPNLNNRSFDQAVQQASSNDRLVPGRDGSLLTAGRELAHLQISSRYAISDPVQFVEGLRDDAADQLVRLSLQRAAVMAASRLTVDEIIDRNEALAADIERSAQDLLNSVDSGILLQSVNLPGTSPPLAIRKTMENLQAATVEVEEALERSRQMANETLTAVAGRRYDDIVGQIENYEVAVDLGDQDAAETRLGEINTLLEDTSTSGEVAVIINRAKAALSQVESTLGSELRRYNSLLPIYQRQPDLVVKRLWFETYARVLDRDDAEIFYVPGDLASMRLHIQGLDDIADRRRQARLRAAQEDTFSQFRNPFSRQLRRAEDIVTEGPGRQLKRNEVTGELEGLGNR